MLLLHLVKDNGQPTMMRLNELAQKITRRLGRFRLRSKLIIAFLFISFSSVATVALVMNYITSKALANEVETELSNLANSQGVAVGNLLLHQIELLQSLRVNEILLNKATLSNSLYEDDLEAIQTDFAVLDEEWKMAVETDLMAQIVLTNSAADELLAFRHSFPDHIEIFITDRYGALLAATNLTTDYYQADEPWWQAAYNKGKGSPFIGTAKFDESSRSLALQLAVPIYAPDGVTVAGILRTTYTLEPLGRLLYATLLKEEGVFLDLLLSNDQVIDSVHLLQARHQTGGQTAVLPIRETTLSALRANTYEEYAVDGVVYLASLASVTTIGDSHFITDLGWSIIARQDRQMALALVASQQRTIWLLAILIMCLSVVGAVITTYYLSRPILTLTATAQQIRDGNLNVQASIRSQDEIGELAETFNGMTRRLRKVIARLEEHGELLEQRVAKRTADLEERTYELANSVYELKSEEEKRERLIAELETKNAELERFSYTISHDLKSPLFTIKGFLGFVQKDAIDGDIERMKNGVLRINNAVDKMSFMLDDLLELSRVGRMINPMETLSLNGLARDAFFMVAGQINERGVDVAILPDLPMIFGDQHRLQMVLQNLVDNAVKFMGDQPEPYIEIGASQVGDEIVCYVQDNGIGIKSGYVEKVFDLFERLDGSSQGTGIGLTLVKRIIDLHNGRVWVESDGVNQGCAFYFTLPQAPEQ
jgi:signal transduction histidine kinase